MAASLVTPFRQARGRGILDLGFRVIGFFFAPFVTAAATNMTTDAVMVMLISMPYAWSLAP